MQLCVICQSFPTSKTIDFVFVDQLCREFADLGVNVTVIAPQSIVKNIIRRISIQRYKRKVCTKNGHCFTLIRPWFLTFGNRFQNFNYKSFCKSVLRSLERLSQKPDCLYGHFWVCANSVLPYAIKNKMPLWVVAGEGSISLHHFLREEEIDSLRRNVNGVICVSSKSKKESIDAGLTDGENCIVIPNAINPNLFFQRDKYEMREKYKLSKDDFILAFVGQFNARKGVNRLCEALKKINNDKIKIMFIGTGAEKPDYDGVLFAKTIPHDILPEYLCCADAFVLPSINEGCSNAIIEAMACGLPILSSDLDFNHDVLDSSNALLFNPLDVDEIAKKIEEIYENKIQRDLLSEGSLNKARQLTINERAKKILNFIKLKV